MSVQSGDGLPSRHEHGDARGPNQRLAKHQRLTESSRIRETFNQQQKQVGKFMVFWLRSGDDTSSRVAVVASKKVGNSVKRTLARRKLREVFRRNRNKLIGHDDVVLVARGHIIQASAPSIEKEFLTLAEQAGIYKRS